MNIFYKYILLVLFVLNGTFANAQIVYQDQDSIIFTDYIKYITPHRGDSIHQIIIRTAVFFQETPYVGVTLESEGEEQLVVNLREFDCTTLVETSLALARTIKSDTISFQNFCQNLKSIRYRNGLVDGYSSRLHYVSDWLLDNESAGIIQNISPQLRGKEIDKPINFMSTNSSKYKHLASSKKELEKIKKVEAKINNAKQYILLDVKDIPLSTKDMKDGDIVFFATQIAGLDYSHMGFVYKTEKETTFIHASSNEKKVVINQINLAQYASQSKNCTGISIARILEP